MSTEPVGRREAIAQNLRRLLEDRALGTTELAARSGVDRSYVSSLANGRARSLPKDGVLTSLARALNCEVAEITGSASIRTATPYERNADIRAIADALNDRPEAARYFAAALRSLIRPVEEDNVLEFVPARTEEKPKEMSDVELHGVAKALGGVIEFRKGALWKEYEVPLVAKVSAGAGIEIFETYEKVRQIPEYYWKAGARAVFKVVGHSMFDMGITDNDLLFVKPTEKPRSGDVVVCSLNGAAFVKEFQRTKNGVSLVSRSDGYQPMEVRESDDLRVFGVVVGRTGNLMGDFRRKR